MAQAPQIPQTPEVPLTASAATALPKRGPRWPFSEDSPASSFSWVDKTPTWSMLNLEIIVLTVLGKKPDTWVVTSSHGDPKGDFGAKESAQRFAVKFAATQIERTMTRLSEIESLQESPANGWRPVGCGIILLGLAPDPSFLLEDGSVAPDVFEQKRTELIDSWRARLRAILQGIER